MQYSKQETTVAILLFTAVIFGNALIFAIIPYLAKPEYGFGYHPFQIIMCMTGIALIGMLPWAKKQGIKGLITGQKRVYLLRGVLEYGSFTLSFFSLSYVGEHFTLSMHTALNYITPLLSTIFSIWILKEKSHFYTWIALGIGIIGLLTITRPGLIPASPGVLFVLGAALGFSLTGITIKLLTRTESSHHIAFYMLALSTLFALPMGILHWQTPNAEGWFWLIAIGVIAYLQQIYVAKAISKVPYSLLIPINFLQLIFVTAISYLVYSVGIDRWTLLGTFIILAGTIYNTNRTRAVATRNATTEAAAIEAGIV